MNLNQGWGYLINVHFRYFSIYLKKILGFRHFEIFYKILTLE